VPNAWILALGFVGMGLAIGLIGGMVGRVIAREQTHDLPAAHWLSRFAIVAAVAVAPLIFIGGLVTSTNSGMAVPDWPQTYGVNMFLYPLGSHTPAPKFLEHAHRLFGAFIGLATLVLLVFTLKIERRTWVRVLAAIAFGTVCVQGVLGGLRVLQDTRIGAMLHGILAQLTFGVVVSLAVVLSDLFRTLPPGQSILDPRTGKRVRVFCTAALHALIIQLIFGAIYRHFRGTHALWTHIGFSVVVTILAILAGSMLTSEPVRRTLVGRRVAVIGICLAAAGAIQFLLGWLAFAFAGRDPDPQSIAQALIRTTHQANGAILLAFATAAFVWGKRLGRAPSTLAATA
jgi:cytochrome c oxidase assembly protein subunit 15